MARYENCQRIRCTGLRHGSDRLRPADSMRYLRVARRLAGWNFPKRAPDQLLEVRAPQIDWHIQSTRRRIDKGADLGSEDFEVRISFHERESRKPFLYVLKQGIAIVTEQYGTDSPGLPCHQHEPEG